MNIEKPISTIRKAVQGSAEDMASKEFLDRPEQKHIRETFKFYKELRDSSPEFLETIIVNAAKSKELKDKVDKQTYKVFSKVWENQIYGESGYEIKIKQAVNQLKESKSKVTHKDLIDLTKEFLMEKTELIKNDPLILNAFKGKEEILNQIIHQESFAMIDIMESYSKNQSIEIINF